MSKQKLTKNQKRRIQSNKQKTLSDYEQRSYEKQHEKQYKKQKAELEWQDESLGEIQSGRVVARYARHADIKSSEGEVFRCNLRRTVNSLVVGDRVAVVHPAAAAVVSVRHLGGADDVLTAPEQGHQILGYRTDIHIIPLMTRQLAGPCHMRLRAVELRF